MNKMSAYATVSQYKPLQQTNTVKSIGTDLGVHNSEYELRNYRITERLYLGGTMKHNILIVDDDQNFCEGTERFLKKEGFYVRSVNSGDEAIALFRQSLIQFSIALVDYNMPDLNGPQTIERLKQLDPELFIMAFSGDDSVKAFNECLNSGAVFFIQKDIRDEKLLGLLHRACFEIEKRVKPVVLASHTENQKLISSIGMIGVSDSLAEVARAVLKYAPTNETVLIRGENGTGKELIAKAIHQNSNRRKKPFIAVNSAAIQSTLAESELFGHIKGSFTDAVTDKTGLIEAADGGTLFLDEIGDMPQSLQVSLLRALQEKTITPVGSTESKKIDFRLIAATNAPLEKLIADGKFREDFYYRLNVLPIHVKPLRERIEDIAPLALHFLNQFNQRNNANKILLESSLEILKKHLWSGNIRELEGTILFLANISTGDTLEIEHFIKKMKETGKMANVQTKKLDNVKSTAQREEKELVIRAIEEGGNISKAARILNISRTTLRSKMKKHCITILNELKGNL